MNEYRKNRDEVMSDIFRGRIWTEEAEKEISRTLAYQMAELQDRIHILLAAIFNSFRRGK